jgi:hypothetical protein
MTVGKINPYFTSTFSQNNQQEDSVKARNDYNYLVFRDSMIPFSEN